MALYKYHYIELDTKRSPRISLQNIVAGETGNVLWITVTNNGETIDMSEKEDDEFIYRVALRIDSDLGTRRQDSDDPDGGITFIEENTGDHGKVNILLSADSFTAGKNRCRLEIYSMRSEDDDTLICSAEWTFDAASNPTGENSGTAYPVMAYWEKLCESYAHGNTGKREGEDTDNSKFYSDMAQEAVAQKVIAPSITSWMNANRNHFDSEMSDDISRWLGEHMTNPSNPAIDTSLSVSGAAADAKKTGEIKSDLKENLLDKLEYVTPSNWYDSANITDGKIMGVDGTESADSDYLHTDYIPVHESDIITCFRSGNYATIYHYKIAVFDEDKQALSAKGSNSNSKAAFTIQSGVSYAIVTFKKSAISGISPIITIDGSTPTSYTQYFDPYKQYTENFLTHDSNAAVQKLTSGSMTSADLKNKYACALPRTTFRQTLGLPEKWYNRSAFSPLYKNGAMSIGNQYSNRKNDYIEFPNETALSSSNGYSWAMYDDALAEIKSENGSQGFGIRRKIIAENLQDCSLLCIGDSTVDHDTMTAKLLDHFTAQSKTLTLLGTLGSGSNKNEGRAGWKATDYLTDRQYNGVTNPFYNPLSETFDFEYYMTNQNYSGVDFVVLQLGINDLYSGGDDAIESCWTAIKAMCDSIIAYNSSIKIILNLPTTPNADQSEHSVVEFLYRNRVVRYNETAMKNALSVYGDTKVRCSYCHLILDADTEIRDDVHPTAEGYQKMAYELINQINCWQNDA